MKRLLFFLGFIALLDSSQAQAPRGAGVRGGKQTERAETVQLYPKFTLGQTLYYQLDFRSRLGGSTVGIIADPQALKEVDVSLSALIRLDVLRVKDPAAASLRPTVRLRTTYTKVAVTTRADVPDPLVETLREQLQKLEQQSVEFTIESNGKVTDVNGLEQVFPEQIKAMHEWISQIGFAASLPDKGIRIGQKWEVELPMNGAIPLAGFVWHEEATYLRDEPCYAARLPSPDQSGASQAEQCAVILSALTLGESKKHKDRTPEEFRKKNLQTAGAVNGKGESLTYISLQNGQVVSVTQTSGQEMDVAITSLSLGSSLRYTGRVETQSQLSLVEGPVAPSK
ncbi:MAG TPA: hypothetical protein VOA41_02780 [Candidatus Dormibacteraeota bacterium]|nr:hypothetical protein [Candidatus Dormibacteraeota bacterium]